MNPEYRESLERTAREAAEMNRKEPGNGYAYALGAVRAIAEDKCLKPAEKIERIKVFLQVFDEKKSTGESAR